MAAFPRPAQFDLFAEDRELIDCSELYRTWLIETNPHGREHEQFLRGLGVGQLIKLMAWEAVRPYRNTFLSREKLSDAILAARKAKYGRDGVLNLRLLSARSVGGGVVIDAQRGRADFYDGDEVDGGEDSFEDEDRLTLADQVLADDSIEP